LQNHRRLCAEIAVYHYLSEIEMKESQPTVGAAVSSSLEDLGDIFERVCAITGPIFGARSSRDVLTNPQFEVFG